MLSTTGRKFLRGPRGTGFLYVRRELVQQLEPPFLDLHSAEWEADGSYRIRDDARRFENWETYYAGKIGLGIAADYAHALGADAIWARLQQLAGRLRDGLSAAEGVTVRDQGLTKAAIVTFTVEGLAATEVQRALAAERINVNVQRKEYAWLDLGERDLDEVVRSSVHYYNTDEEIDQLVDAVRRARTSRA
jgi:selenocysteine lyase/cysteine desulfurase